MDVHARPAVGAVMTELMSGVHLPSPTHATATHAGYDVELVITVQPSPDGLTGQPSCSSMTVNQRPGGPPITSVGLRAIAVAHLVRSAVEQVLTTSPPTSPPGVITGSGSLVARPATLAGSGDVSIAGVPATATASAPSGSASGSWRFTGTASGVSGRVPPDPDTAERIRRQGPTDESLRMVAAIYRHALASDARPTRAVQTALRLPRSTTGDWIRLARQRGFLPPSAGRGKATG